MYESSKRVVTSSTVKFTFWNTVSPLKASVMTRVSFDHTRSEFFIAMTAPVSEIEKYTKFI